MIFVDLLYFICVSVLPACMYMYKYHMFGWCLQRSKEDVESPGTGVADGCKPPCGFWELNSCLLQKQVNLTMEPSP